MKNNKNGITLIALVITIIIMLILAGVSLNATIGDNGIITQAMIASFYEEMTEINEQKEMSKVSSLLTEERAKVEKGKFTAEEVSLETLRKFSNTLKAEILYARDGFGKGKAIDTKEMWKENMYACQDVFKNTEVGEWKLIGNIFYISEKVAGKKEEYIYDEVTDMCFKIKDTKIKGYTVHSLEYAKLVFEGKRTTLTGEMDIKVIKATDGTSYYEPDLSYFSNKTDIVYYSADTESVQYKPIQEYKKEGRPAKIKVGEETYTFADYTETNRIWANVRCTANGLESWWTWIPRYMYKIEGNSIKVKFVDINNNPLNPLTEEEGATLEEAGYTLHEGFDVEEGGETKHLKGIWFSKYAPSKGDKVGIDTSNVKIPDMTGYNVEQTYIVLYDSTGNTIVSEEDIKLADILEDTAVISETKILESGRIDETKLNTAVGTNKWFDYENRIWANIKTKTNGLESWWVWIPRYAYKIDKDFNDISVILLDTDDKPLDKEKYGEELSDYYTVHEGFREGDGLEGIWFSKYAPSLTEVVAIDKTEPEPPDISNFDENNTWIEVYNEDGTFSETKLSDIADIDQFARANKWYDYDNQVWANVKCTANGLESWWVWIPRYAYKIDKDYNEIRVILIDENNKSIDREKYGETLSEYYTVHEGFDVEVNGTTKHLKGIWFSKYTPTGTMLPDSTE